MGQRLSGALLYVLILVPLQYNEKRPSLFSLVTLLTLAIAAIVTLRLSDTFRKAIFNLNVHSAQPPFPSKSLNRLSLPRSTRL
ncbi:hypothetical protein KCU71_g102, partial [Aureobasidium melanogenum]